MSLALAPALKTLFAVLALIPVGLVGLAILLAAILVLAVGAGVIGMWTLGKAQRRVLRPGPGTGPVDHAAPIPPSAPR